MQNREQRKESQIRGKGRENIWRTEGSAGGAVQTKDANYMTQTRCSNLFFCRRRLVAPFVGTLVSVAHYLIHNLVFQGSL